MSTQEILLRGPITYLVILIFLMISYKLLGIRKKEKVVNPIYGFLIVLLLPTSVYMLYLTVYSIPFLLKSIDLLFGF